MAASVALAGAPSIGVPIASADVATNGGASNITSTSATLNGLVNTTDPKGTGWVFQYGTSPSYGSFAPQPAKVGGRD